MIKIEMINIIMIVAVILTIGIIIIIMPIIIITILKITIIVQVINLFIFVLWLQGLPSTWSPWFDVAHFLLAAIAVRKEVGKPFSRYVKQGRNWVILRGGRS